MEQTEKDLLAKSLYADDIDLLILAIRRLEDEKFQSVVFEEFDEQYMYFFGAALLLLVIEMLIGERRSKRRLFE